jgi:hypothetical protein
VKGKSVGEANVSGNREQNDGSLIETMTDLIENRPRARSRLALANLTNGPGIGRRKKPAVAEGKSTTGFRKIVIGPRYEPNDVYENMRFGKRIFL